VNGRELIDYRAEAWITKGLRGKAGERIAIPVNLRAVYPGSFNGFGIDSIKAVLKVNPTVIYTESITAGTLFMSNSDVIYEFDEKVPGTLEVRALSKKNDIYNEAGSMAELQCRLLLGDSDKTLLHIDTVKIYASRPVTIIQHDGSLAMDGDCAFNSRSLEFGGRPGIILKTGGVCDDIIKMEMKITSEDRTTVGLFNSVAGQMVSVADGTYKPGIYDFEIPVSGFSSGMYFVKLQTADFVYVEKVIIINSK
jgi:hypothetical protein